MSEAIKFVVEWLKEGKYPDVQENIERMIDEVIRTYEVAKQKGVRPQSNGTWHDNQCVLLGLLCRGDNN